MVEVEIFCGPCVLSAASNPGKNLYLTVASPFNNGEPLHRWEGILTTRLEG